MHIEGRLRIREYEFKDNGGKRQRAEIVASRVQFLGAPPADAQRAGANLPGMMCPSEWFEWGMPAVSAGIFLAALLGGRKSRGASEVVLDNRLQTGIVEINAIMGERYGSKPARA